MKNLQFETLPKKEQNFRWSLFLESDGYRKDISKKQISKIAKKLNINLKK